jgi:hypothetical protein
MLLQIKQQKVKKLRKYVILYLRSLKFYFEVLLVNKEVY